ncbi:MAG: hypothetical protein LBH04_00465 [Tannerellaceae bacterium]|nr:hypothetical protein [Tannerellaceae bacterium]
MGRRKATADNINRRHGMTCLRGGCDLGALATMGICPEMGGGYTLGNSA